MHLLSRTGLVPLILATLLAACAAPAPSPTSTGRAPNQADLSSQPAAPKRIVTAVVGQPATWVERLRPSVRTGTWNLYELVSAGTTLLDDQSELQPQLAQAVPSLENGLWRLLPEGRMETTWKLRPGLTWHDGTPLTSADVMFTALIDQDNEIPFVRHAPYSAVEAVDAPDAETVVVRWKQPYIDADQLFTRNYASIVAKHLLEPVYAADKSALVDNPYWTTDYVGAGPYRVQSYEVGGPITLQAFDRYVLGRPKIDEIEIRPFAAAEPLMVGVLAGGIDITLGSPGMSLDQSVEVANQWRDGRIEYTLGNWLPIHPQLLNPNPPIVGNVTFRKALMHAMDRQSMSDTLRYGREPVAHSFMNPGQAQYRQIEEGIIKYDYDPRKAASMIEGLGYSRGPDGIYRDGAGQRLAVELRAWTGTGMPFRAVVAEQWRQVGVDVQEEVMPPQRATDLEFVAAFPAFDLVPQPNDVGGISLLHSRFARRPETNFRGSNFSRMMDAQFDALIERWQRSAFKRSGRSFTRSRIV